METENSPPRFRSIQTHNAERTLSLPVEILEEILPVEILEEILSRLPVKSLLKFRCVSKSWRSLIDSQRFIKNHLENSTKNPTFARRRIIWKPSPQNNILKQCSLPSFLNEPFNDRFTFDDSINIQCESICLVGCCNGLVCVLLDREHFILWNPSTKMSKKLPDLDDEMKHTYITEYGFGFDEWNDDYKVFGVKFRFFHANGSQVISKLYSLKTNSWKITKNTKEFHLASGAKFAGGKLHWEKIWGPNWDIVYFDLKSEVYGKVEQPCYSEGVFNPSLGVIGGCLCVLCDYSETHFDLWVMKHDGVKESWDKVMTLANLHDPPGVRFFSPLCIGPSGEILLIYGWTFMIYYPKDNVFRHPLTIELDSFHEADVFVESLVPLVPDVEP